MEHTPGRVGIVRGMADREACSETVKEKSEEVHL